MMSGDDDSEAAGGADSFDRALGLDVLALLLALRDGDLADLAAHGGGFVEHVFDLGLERFDAGSQFIQRVCGFIVRGDRLHVGGRHDGCDLGFHGGGLLGVGGGIGGDGGLDFLRFRRSLSSRGILRLRFGLRHTHRHGDILADAAARNERAKGVAELDSRVALAEQVERMSFLMMMAKLPQVESNSAGTPNSCSSPSRSVKKPTVLR